MEMGKASWEAETELAKAPERGTCELEERA